MLHGLINTFVGGLSFIVVLSMIVFIHELGHYSVARFFKVSVETFSIGFGKPIVKWTAKSGTGWKIGRIPLGGYVKFTGDAGAASNPDTEHLKKMKLDMDANIGTDAWKSCLHFKPLYQRALVVFAGPMANFILAAIIFAGLALVYGSYHSIAKISSITLGGAAEQAGFMIGDEFVSINGKSTTEIQEVIQTITLRSGDMLSVVVNRTGALVNLEVIPVKQTRMDGVGGKYEGGMIGVGFKGDYNHKSYSVLESARYGIQSVSDSIASTGLYIGRIFQGKENGKALGSIGKIAAITGKVGVDAANTEGSIRKRAGAVLSRLLNLAAALSVGLGFANLMPIPVLDGGHLMYYGYEAIMKRPLSEKTQELGFRIGFTVLITLFLVLSWNDIGYVADLFGNKG